MSAQHHPLPEPGPGDCDLLDPDSRAAKAIATQYPMGSLPQCADFGRFICTRPAGHEGPHVAHGPQGEVYAWWGQRGSRHVH